MTRARIYSQSGAGGAGAGNVTLATLTPFLTTSNVVELTNLYFTNARVLANLQLASINDLFDVNTTVRSNGQALIWNYSSNTWIPGNVATSVTLNSLSSFLTTANVAESDSNLYYTNTRARTALSPADPTIIIDYVAGTIRANISAVSNVANTTDAITEGYTNVFFTNARVNAFVQPWLTTANIRETGNSLYFTNARVQTALSFANLADFGDVVYTGSPSNNQVLTWNSTAGYWTNATANAGAAASTANFAETSNVANTVLTLLNFTTYDLPPDPNGVNPYYSNSAVLALFLPGGNTRISTSNVIEGDNLYFTNARAQATVSLGLVTPFLTTANVKESSSNLYYSNTRVNAFVQPFLTTANVLETSSGLYYTNARVYSAVSGNLALKANVSDLTTSNVTELNNLYYTNTRVNAFVQPFLTTANVLETSSGLYYTNARVLSNIAISNIDTKFLTVTGNIYATENVTTSKNLVLSKNSLTQDDAAGSGIYIEGANASILYNNTTNSLDVNKNIIITGNLIPSISGVFNLGSQSKKFKTMVVGAQTIYLGNVVLGESEKGGFDVKTASGLPSDGSFANITAIENIIVSRFTNGANSSTEANIYFGGNVAQFVNNRTGNIYYGIKKNDTWDSFAGVKVQQRRIIPLPVYSTYTWYVANSFATDYVLSGYSSGNDIPLTVTAGDTLVFAVNAPTHDLWIKTAATTGTGQGVTTGVITNNGTDNGNVTWNTTGVVPGTYYYKSANDVSMGGTITVLADTQPAGNVRSDVIIYNDNELTNNSVARVSILGDGNTLFYGNVYQDSGSRLFANLVGNVTGRVSTLDNHTTGNLVEGNNLYYTNSRVRSALSGGTGVSYNSSTGSISIGQDVSTYANVTFNRITITDNLTIYGNVTTYNSNNISTSDNMIYLNNGSNTSNPDIGFAFNYNDGTYHHGGFFRDASDNGTFKVFDNYVPEPDASIFIDTNDASFRLANIQATTFFGNVSGTAGSLNNFTTANLSEGNNLYYTNSRVISAVTPYLTTANLNETVNLYYTNSRVISAVTPYLTTANVVELNNLYYTNARVYSAIAGNINLKANTSDLTTANVSELTNLYYTNARVYSAIVGNLAIKANVVDLTTANVSELTNLYYTNSRVYSNVIALLPTLAGSGIQIQSNGQINVSVASDIANSVLTLSNFTTANLIEGSNLYYTNARAISAVTPYLTTANVVEVNNQYFTNARSVLAVTPYLTTANVSELTNLYYTNARVYSAIVGNLATKANVVDLTTANVVELNNLYYTNARVYSAIVGNLATKANVVDLTTANVVESGTGLYYTNARVYSAIAGNLATKANVVDLTTANVVEVNNQYFTNARVLANVSQMSINVFTDVDITGIQTNGILIWNGSAFISGIASAAAVSNTALIAYQADHANTSDNSNVANSVLTISNFTTSNLTEGTNLYFTNTRAAIGLTGLNVSVNDLYAAGNLTVQGVFTTLNVNTLDIEDKNITLGKGLSTSAEADSAGITIDGAQANIKYLVSGDKFNINKNLEIIGDVRANTWTGLYSSNVIETNNLYFTNARSVLAVTPYLTTANVVEVNNQYFTNARVSANLQLQSINVFADVDISGINNDELLLWNSVDRVFRPSTFTGKLTTANVVELTNLYFTNARVYSALSDGAANLSLYNLTTNGVLTVSSGTTDESIAGIEFENNPAGGGGDTAKIKYYAANIGINDDTILEISVANNPGDSINLKTAGGGVGVNVARPVAEFDVAGNINARNSLIFSTLVTGPSAAFNNITSNIWNNLYTANVSEVTNLYYTNSRVISVLTPYLTTSNVSEGSNLYYTNARVYSAIAGNLATKANVVDLTTANVVENNNLYYTNSRVVSVLTSYLTTANVVENNNLYYTNARVYSAIVGNLVLKANVVDLTTANVVENNNLYYTNARVYSAIAGNLALKANVVDLTTANVVENNNQYFTNARVLANVSQMSINVFADVDITGVQNGYSLTWNGLKFVPSSSTGTADVATFAYNANIANSVLSINNFTTANLTEGNNLYYTNSRVVSALTGNVTIGNVAISSKISYANTSGTIKVYQYYNESTLSLDTIFT